MMEKEILETKQEKQEEENKCALCGAPETLEIEQKKGDNVCALCGASEKWEEKDDKREKGEK